MDKPNLEKLWGQALVAVNTVEEEAAKVAGRLAEAAGWNQEEIRKNVRTFAERLASQRKDLEQSLEDGVKRTLSLVRLPRKEQLGELNERLDRISKRIDALWEKK